jgi:hypothetical protein
MDDEIMNDVVSEKELEIIDYINECTADQDSMVEAIVLDKVAKKYGTPGIDVFESLTSDYDDDEDMLEDCAECGQASQEWVDAMQEKMKLFESCMITTYDDLIEDILNEFIGQSLTDDILIDKLTPGLNNDNIDDELLALKKVILFRGISDGWLIKEYFKDGK